MMQLQCKQSMQWKQIQVANVNNMNKNSKCVLLFESAENISLWNMLYNWISFGANTKWNSFQITRFVSFFKIVKKIVWIRNYSNEFIPYASKFNWEFHSVNGQFQLLVSKLSWSGQSANQRMNEYFPLLLKTGWFWNFHSFKSGKNPADAVFDLHFKSDLGDVLIEYVRVSNWFQDESTWEGCEDNRPYIDRIADGLASDIENIWTKKKKNKS